MEYKDMKAPLSLLKEAGADASTLCEVAYCLMNKVKAPEPGFIRVGTVGDLVQGHFDAVSYKHHAQFELVREPLGFRARHNVTGQSYQAHDIATGLRHEAKQ